MSTQTEHAQWPFVDGSTANRGSPLQLRAVGYCDVTDEDASRTTALFFKAACEIFHATPLSRDRQKPIISNAAAISAAVVRTWFHPVHAAT